MAESIHPNPDNSFGFYNVSTATENGRFGGPAVRGSNNIPQYRADTVAVLPLSAVDTAGGIFNWQPDQTRYTNIIVHRIVLSVTTQSSGACTVSIGNAANATTLSATLLAGQSVAAAGVFGATTPILATPGQFITGSTASGASAGLVGNVYIYYCAA